MRRLVQAPRAEIEADRGSQAGADGALRLSGIVAVHEGVVGPRAARRSPARTARARRAGRAAAAPAGPRACRARTGRAARRSARRPRSRRRRPPLGAARRDARAVAEEREIGSARAACQASKPADSASASSRTSEAGTRDGAVALSPRLAHACALEIAEAERRRRARRSPRRSARRRCARAVRRRAWPWPRRAPRRRAGAC